MRIELRQKLQGRYPVSAAILLVILISILLQGCLVKQELKQDREDTGVYLVCHYYPDWAPDPKSYWYSTSDFLGRSRCPLIREN